MSSIIQTTVLITLIGAVMASQANIANNCGFDIYCQAVRGADANHYGLDGDIVQVFSGTSWTPDGRFDLELNMPAITIKCDVQPDISQPYQLQANIGFEGKTFYDASAVDGNPFAGQTRAIGIPGDDCPFLECAPGQHAECESPPHQTNVCDTKEDVFMWFC